MSRVRPKHKIEYVLLVALGGLARVLPYRAALGVAFTIAWPMHFIFGFRRAEARRRIRSVLPELSDRDIARVAWLSWRNTTFNAVDMIRMGDMTDAWAEKHVDRDECVRVLLAQAATGRGGVVALPHMGAWDLAGGACCRAGVPVFSIAAQQRNPLTNAYMNKLRRAPGMDTVERGAGTMKQVIRKLRAGGMLAILPDVRMRTEGIKTHFLGGEANLGKGTATFARQVDVPIFPCIVTRRGWTTHRIHLHPAILPDPSLGKAEDIARLTRAVAAIIDDAIRREPEQWFWYNKRWVLDPLD